MIRTNHAFRLAQPVNLLSADPNSRASVQCIVSETHLRRFEAELEALRRRSRHPDAPMAIPRWLEARRPPPGWSQRTILLRSQGVIQAAVYLQECTPAGLPTGYFRGFDAQGDTVILCEALREKELLQQTIDLLLASHRAFLILMDRPIEAPACSGWYCSTVPLVRRWYHPLRATFDDTLALFGRRTRRNLRYALRRVERNRWRCHPSLTAAQLSTALTQLASTCTHPFLPHEQQTRLDLAMTMDGGFAMGLSDADGRWLSCIIGRRTPCATEIFWQSNARSQGNDSLSLTMRALFLREEIARGTRQIRYISGTTPLMQHSCTPVPGLQTAIGRPGLRLSLIRRILKTTAASPTNDLHHHL
jgi:hypothetical protein